MTSQIRRQARARLRRGVTNGGYQSYRWRKAHRRADGQYCDWPKVAPLEVRRER